MEIVFGSIRDFSSLFKTKFANFGYFVVKIFNALEEYPLTSGEISFNAVYNASIKVSIWGYKSYSFCIKLTILTTILAAFSFGSAFYECFKPYTIIGIIKLNEGPSIRWLNLIFKIASRLLLF